MHDTDEDIQKPRQYNLEWFWLSENHIDVCECNPPPL
jgi:hypothetical protein